MDFKRSKHYRASLSPASHEGNFQLATGDNDGFPLSSGAAPGVSTALYCVAGGASPLLARDAVCNPILRSWSRYCWRITGDSDNGPRLGTRNALGSGGPRDGLSHLGLFNLA
jgi:hypothetical protein